MSQFWQNLPKPFRVLAPMDGVTDVVFRQIIAEIGKPEVMVTEFMMTDGFVSVGKKRVMERLLMNDVQKPMIAQIWGANPKHFYETAREVAQMGFAGIDINMGCPDRTVVKNGACSALIKNHSLAAEIIAAVKEGAGDVPVSVKTRLGFERAQLSTWIPFLLEQNIAALTVHLRTVKELSKVPAHWELMPEIKKYRDAISPTTMLIGNGDILSQIEIEEKYEKYSIDGFMVGRGIFADPWMFRKNRSTLEITKEDRLRVFLQHIDAYDKRWGKEKNFANLKKFAKTYISDFPQSAKLREQLMLAKSMNELRSVLVSEMSQT